MDGYRVRLIDVAAAVLWVVTIVLLILSRGDAGLIGLRGWALACSAAAAATTVAAVIACASTKVLRAVHRAQLEDLLRSR